MVNSKENILKKVKEHKIKFIHLWFTDILGFLKSVTITSGELIRAIDEGIGFDGSSIEGFARIDESDMIAVPDISTFQILPIGMNEGYSIARMFCDIMKSDKTPYQGDPRWILKKITKEVSDQMKFTSYMGAELEYFYFKNSTLPPQLLDRGGYFDLTPTDVASDLRNKTIQALESMEISAECSHHEVASSQHEIDLKFTNTLSMADNIMTSKLLIKEIALKHGAYATFMPKPIYGENGSGMHTHQSLFRENKNVFFDSKEKNHISKTAKQYIAGLLRHSPEITVVTNQWVNSYKRLVPGYEAPVYLTWALKNRSDLIRVPEYQPHDEKAMRIEFRSPDPACNPYLTFAVMLAAGAEGIKNAYEPLSPTQQNVYQMTEEERKHTGIDMLPGSLYEAIKIAEKSNLLRKTLGEHIFTKLLENRKIEWNNYTRQVSSYELEKFFAVL